MVLHFGLRLEPINIITFLLAGYIVFFSFFSLIIKERIYLSETLVATIFGILIGPAVLNLLNLDKWGLSSNTIFHQFSRIVIAIQVMIAGVSLPKVYLWKEKLSLFMLLLPGMAFAWIVASALSYAFLPITFIEALLIGGCIAPTDPVLANSIVRGRFAEKHVPMHVRNIISAESGANDGLGYPYILFAIILLIYEEEKVSLGAVIGEWIYNVWLYQIVLSCVVGYFMGYVARVGLRYAHSHDWIDKESFLAFSFSFALFLMGGVALIGSDDLLAIFIAGNAFTWDDWFRIKTEETHIQEVIDMLFTSVYFIYFGCMIPWKDIGAIGYVSLVFLSITVLVLKRLPAVLAMYRLIPAIVTWREAIFAGWFGPIGAGAIFYALEARLVLKEHGHTTGAYDLVYPVIMWFVLCSVVVHGVTVPLMKIGQHVKREVIVPFSRTVTEISRTSTMTTVKKDKKKWFGKKGEVAVTVIKGFDEQLVLAREEEVDLESEEGRETVVNWADASTSNIR